MNIFSTILFVNGHPVGYRVSRHNNNVHLNPAENPNRGIFPPAISARQEGGRWLVEGTEDRDLIDQVIEDVTNSEANLFWNDCSAAP